jgi:cell shape-determining protein MreC
MTVLFIILGIIAFICLMDFLSVVHFRRTEIRRRLSFYRNYNPPRAADEKKDDLKSIEGLIKDDEDTAKLNRRQRKALAHKVQQTMRLRAATARRISDAAT